MPGADEPVAGDLYPLKGRISLTHLRRVLCAASGGLALAGLAGWVLHVDTLKTLLPGLPEMKVNTALCLLALSVARWPARDGGAGPAASQLLRVGCEIAAVAVTAATLGEYAFGVSLGIDEFLIALPRPNSAPFPGRPSAMAMIAIASIAAASMMLGRKPRWCAAAAHGLVAPAAAAGTLGLICYGYDVEKTAGFGRYVAVSLGTALAVCALSAATLLSRSAESWGSVLAGRPAARAVFTRLLPASFVLPSATGLLVLAGVRSGLYTPYFGFAIFAVMTVMAFIALSWETASVAARVEGALQKSNAGLLAARLRAEEATRAKSRFLAGMSHELRTPLHAILGYAELLSTEGALRAGQLARVMQMLSTGRHLLETINSVLAMSEIETSRVVLRPAAIDVRQVAADCLDLVRPAAGGKGLDIKVEVASDVPQRILADATRLRQIVVNLLGNAVKFTDRGRVTLRLRLEKAACVCFEVADTGRGIPPGLREKLFGEFERLGVERESQAEGAGLGLAIAARLAVVMGGRIDHADNPGGGSIFRLSVPVAQAEAASPAAPLLPNLAQTLSESAADVVPRHVLIADDVDMNREIATAFLRSAGHVVIQAATGEDAVLEAARQDFDVVLMDVRMGDIDGFEATRRIRALCGARARVPIIAMTAHVFTDQIEACGRAGMDFHLPKPFDRAALLAAVEAAIEWRDSSAGLDENLPGRAPRTGILPVIDMARFESMASYLPAEGLVRHLENLVRTLETLKESLRTHDLASTGIPARLVDEVHTLAGKAGMMGFVRLASSAGLIDHLARGAEKVSEVHVACLLRDIDDAVRETRCRLEVVRGV